SGVRSAYRSAFRCAQKELLCETRGRKVVTQNSGSSAFGKAQRSAARLRFGSFGAHLSAAVKTMSDQITIENCYEYLVSAKKEKLNDLREKAYKFMSDNFLQVLRDSSVYGRLTRTERELILTLRMEGKESLMVAEINEVDERAKQWKSLTRIPDEINTKGCGMCTMYNYLFVAGGIRGQGDRNKLSDKVFCYNPVTDSWSEIRPLNQPRSQLKLVSMDGYLYAIGGECLFTVERYDPRADRWSPVAPLPKGAFAVAHEATTCNGELYVSGGSLFYRLLKYDPKQDDWEECPYNNSRKRSADMVAFKHFIYRFDVIREQGMSVFKYNTVVKMWHQCASFPQTIPASFRCAVKGSRVFCVNKHQTLQFIVGEDNERFAETTLGAPLESKGVLLPFTLQLPDRD
uniref:Kelch repeat and BTB (POZ) domain containing 11 n=1 Tax=Electrophorus electricus TaxID=8005 RepID=A0A4W4F5N3_ELEEL